MTEKTLKIGQISERWWRYLNDGKTGAARRASAELRRASSTTDILMHPYTQELYRSLNTAGVELWHSGRVETLAALALLLPHVKEANKKSLPKVMGEKPVKDGSPIVSGLRFQDVVRTENVFKVAIKLRRLMPLVKANCDISALALDLLYWSERTRNNWCFYYYNSLPPGVADPKYIKTELEHV